MTSTTDCQTCKDIWMLFATPVAANVAVRQLSLGQLERVLASPCPQHTALLEYLFEIIPDLKTKELSHFSVVFERKSQTPFVSFRLCGLDNPTHDDHHLLLLLERRPEVHGHPGLARSVDPQWIDVDRIRSWFNDCIVTHGEVCANPFKIEPAIPELLIDVKRRCIVSASHQTRFVALSYRFGNSVPFCLNERELRELRGDSAIDRPDVLNKLPLTVKHAISLTAAMDERYLWADALCIVHGRPVGTAEQLGQMSAIYATALMTIVADDGDGLTGLRGLPGISIEPRQVTTHETFAFHGERLVLWDRAAHHVTSKGAYHQRCWTFQEFTMSARKLIFKHGRVHWICQRCQWHEDVEFEKEPGFDSHLKTLLLSSVPDMRDLGLSLSRYNQRNLTLDQDALPAISGFLTVASRTFVGGFLYGLPEMKFDSALGWKPAFSRKGLIRRREEPKELPLAPGDLGTSYLPSWSWIAWKGPFVFPTDEGTPIRSGNAPSAQNKVVPVAQWYTGDDPQGQYRRRIDSAWHGKRGTMSMPTSVTASISAPLMMPRQTQYLFAKTKKTFVWASHSASSETKSTARDPILKLWSSAAHGSEEIGELHLQTDEQLRSWRMSRSARGTRTNEAGRFVEVVAINRVVVAPGTGFDSSQETRITVLWVKWKEGIAYRQACGFVREDAWVLLDLVDVDLVLG